ncbi:MAG: HupE/UreJ family protein [Acidobacteriota bacterium]
MHRSPGAGPGRFRRAAAAALAGIALLGGATSAHEIPNEVTVYTFIRPEGNRLTFLVRAPMSALRDIDVPLRDGGYLDLPRIGPSLHDAATLWIGDFVKIYENGQPLGTPEVTAARVSLPADRTFESYDQAMAHLTGAPLDPDTDLYWQQGLLDVAFVYPIRSDQSQFAISPGLTRLGLRVNVVLRFQQPGHPERAFDVHGDPGIVELDPRWHQAVLHFVEEGFAHILDGIDHLLFLFCLVIPFRQVRALVVIVTSFTIAHSVTLVASAYDLAPTSLWFPPLVETLIAVSIVYMAFENIVGASLERRWLVTFGFGLVHGFGFSFALRDTLQFAGDHVLTSLLAFNVGVELGQLLVLAVLIPAIALLFRFVVAERVGTILLSALVAHTAWHWAMERGSDLMQFPWPEVSLEGLLVAVRLAMVIVAAGGVMWLLAGVLRLPERPAPPAGAGTPAGDVPTV